MSWSRHEHRPIAHQHTMPSLPAPATRLPAPATCLPAPATCLPAHANNRPPATHPTVTHLAHQPSAPNCSTITRTMNSPLPFCKPASYPRPNSATTPCSPILPDGSPLQQWTDPNTSCYRSTSATSTSSSWPAAANLPSSTPTHALTSGFFSSDTTYNSKSWTTKHLKDCDNTSSYTISSTNSCPRSQNDPTRQNGRYNQAAFHRNTRRHSPVVPYQLLA